MNDHGRSIRKRTGGRLRPIAKRKKHQLGRGPTETQVGEKKFKTINARGNSQKVRAISTDVASISVDGEVRSTDIEDVIENPANPNYVRRNIITKGALIQTGEGTARVTSRPGQDGQVNAVLEE
jgi:small subunit ribosomal protein S8e